MTHRIKLTMFDSIVKSVFLSRRKTWKVTKTLNESDFKDGTAAVQIFMPHPLFRKFCLSNYSFVQFITFYGISVI